MTGANSGNQDPSQQPGTADELLADVMRIGGTLDGHEVHAEELTAALGGVFTQQAELKQQREAAEQAVADEYNGKLGAVGMNADYLKTETEKLARRKVAAQKKVGKLGVKLQGLAAAPDAARPTILTFAAFKTTEPDFTAEAVGSINRIDEVVRREAGQPFVLTQDGHLAFGKIEEPNDGLIIDTDKSTNWTEVVQFPVSKTNLTKGGRKKPSYGYLTRTFDGAKYVEEEYDMILKRHGQDGDVIDPNRYPVSSFNLYDGPLALTRPTHLQVATAESVTAEIEGQNFWSKENSLFTGESAMEFLHKVVGARLIYITESLGPREAMSEFGHLMAVSAKIGLSINSNQVPELERLLQA